MIKYGIMVWTAVVGGLCVHMVMYNWLSPKNFNSSMLPVIKSADHDWDEMIFTEIYTIDADKDCKTGD
tara:strand:+ start:272 stop:475 length:204 start_codon:yes stop_codon:yes gene_type:complete